jgi:uncharacterized protein with ParB-like and HNH nuclease domain
MLNQKTKGYKMGNHNSKEKILTLSLKEVISPETLSIPALQRGLVWKPDQVELLWDSILRGFPIGSFVITKADEISRQKVNEGEYFLLDGQQRLNAIELGLKKYKYSSNDSILWFDLYGHKITDKSTRKYWIKVCTLAHPWGYENKDEC